MSDADALSTYTARVHADLHQHYEEKNSSLLAYWEVA
jgi:hypothetical protein